MANNSELSLYTISALTAIVVRDILLGSNYTEVEPKNSNQHLYDHDEACNTILRLCDVVSCT